MALDGVRNAAYERALAKHVTPESVVLDLGAGVGILGLLAAKHGARHVYCVEPQDLGALSTEIAEANGWADRVTFLHGRIEELELPEKVDVIVSAMTGNVLFNEDLLPTVFHARDEHLREGGVLIPSTAAIDVMPVASPKMIRRHLDCWAEPHLGLDLSPARRYATNAIVFRDAGLHGAEPLGETTELFTTDLETMAYRKLNVTAELRVVEAGMCDGIAAWLRMKLGDEWLSTGPFDPAVHWSASFVPVDPAVAVKEGDTIEFRLLRPPYGDWVWRLRCGDEMRQGSTMFGKPLSTAIANSRDEASPKATERARAVSAVISALDGTRTVAAITEQIRQQFPDLFATEQRVENFVRQMIRTHSRS